MSAKVQSLQGHSVSNRSLSSFLRCPDCFSDQLYTCRADAQLQHVCAGCDRTYGLVGPGIPSMWANIFKNRASHHEKHWNELSETDYEQVCDDTNAVLNAADEIELQYCGGAVLEVGCGGGRFLSKLRERSKVQTIVGVDVSIGMLSAAWKRGHRSLIHAPGEHLPIADQSFDSAASTFSAYKYVNRRIGYPEIARVLKPGGYFVFDLLNYWPYLMDYVWWNYLSKGRWPKNVSSEYILADNMRSVGAEIRMLRDAGFKIVQIKSIPYIPLLRSRIKKVRCINGRWGSKIAYTTIFVTQKR